MKKVVVVGWSSLIVSVAELLNPLEMKVVGLGDTRSEAWNVFNENGDLKDEFDEMPVMPVDLSVGFDPDVIVVAAADEATANSLRYTVIKAGYLGDILFFNELMSQFSVVNNWCSMSRLPKLANPTDVEYNSFNFAPEIQ